MIFTLNPELIDMLVYAMENQEAIHVLDTRTLQILPEENIDQTAVDEDGRIIPLPSWKPVDGFRLMESFAAKLRNPLFREELHQILQSGRGVFRQFKDALKTRPDMERLWFSWKQRAMKQRIHDWYNGLREIWGLQPLAWDDSPDQDTDELVLWDFEFRHLEAPELDGFAALDRAYFDEAHAGLGEGEREFLFRRQRSGIPLPGTGENSRVLGAFTPSGDLVACLWYWWGDGFGVLVQLGVLDEFRGLGIAKACIKRFRQEADRHGGSRAWPILCSLPDSASFLERHVVQGRGGPAILELRFLAGQA